MHDTTTTAVAFGGMLAGPEGVVMSQPVEGADECFTVLKQSVVHYTQ